jgi:hypothetical protein
MITELVSRVFSARNISHIHHWKTKSYAQHVALGGFYDGVIDSVDAIVENFQGLYGDIGDVEAISGKAPKDIVKYLSDEADWIEANRDEITQGSDSLGNLVDNLVNTYTKTIFLLGLK